VEARLGLGQEGHQVLLIRNASDAERNREFGATLPRTWHRQWLDISMRMILTTG
jgi:hypothetical protein